MEEKQNRVYDTGTLLKDFDNLMKVVRRVGERHFEKEEVEQIAQDARIEYEKIILLLPDVGGEESMFTDLMVQSGQTVAFYRACKNRSLREREIGELIYEVAEEQIRSLSRIKKWFAKLIVFTRYYQKKWRRAMEDSQTREYPMNWFGEFVEGEGLDFEYGFDFLECGFLKLAQDIGGLEIAPYVCLCDFARMRGLGVGFQRTQTLARGHSRCDFRFSKRYNTPRGWPPEDLDEVKNSPKDIVT